MKLLFDGLQAVLAEADMSMDDLVSVQIFLRPLFVGAVQRRLCKAFFAGTAGAGVWSGRDRCCWAAGLKSWESR